MISGPTGPVFAVMPLNRATKSLRPLAVMPIGEGEGSAGPRANTGCLKPFFLQVLKFDQLQRGKPKSAPGVALTIRSGASVFFGVSCPSTDTKGLLTPGTKVIIQGWRRPVETVLILPLSGSIETTEFA